jgi:hypothetical protein
MSTIATSAPATPPLAQSDARRRRSQLLGRLTGLFFILTFVTSIPAVLSLYAPALRDPTFVLGGGFDAAVAWGALLELLLILANIGSALTLFPVLRQRFEVLSLAYVAARLTECGLIAVGIIALMALNTLRLHAESADPDALQVVAGALVALHDWTFRIGPGIVVGVGNGLILGYMMWETRLVPRTMSVLGLVGGPAIIASGLAVLLGGIEAGSTLQVLATIPEFLWELILGFWLLFRGFSTTALRVLDVRHA